MLCCQSFHVDCYEQFSIGVWVMVVQFLTAILIYGILASGQCESVELYETLNRVIAYFIQNANARSPDAMLGVYLCKGDYMNENYWVNELRQRRKIGRLIVVLTGAILLVFVHSNRLFISRATSEY